MSKFECTRCKRHHVIECDEKPVFCLMTVERAAWQEIAEKISIKSTAEKIISTINGALYRDSRSEKAIAKAAGLVVNTIRHFRNTKNIRLDTLILLCSEIGLVLDVREKK